MAHSDDISALAISLSTLDTTAQSYLDSSGEIIKIAADRMRNQIGNSLYRTYSGLWDDDDVANEISSLSWEDGYSTVIITCANAHHLVNGDIVELYGFIDGGLQVLNREFRIDIDQAYIDSYITDIAKQFTVSYPIDTTNLNDYSSGAYLSNPYKRRLMYAEAYYALFYLSIKLKEMLSKDVMAQARDYGDKTIIPVSISDIVANQKRYEREANIRLQEYFLKKARL